MKQIIAFSIFLLSCISLNAQFRMVGTGTWSTLTDSTYQATVTFNADLSGNGYLATAIVDTFMVFTGTEKIYTVDSVWGQSFSGATMRIKEYNGTQGAPSGQIMCYDPAGKTTLPQAPLGSTGSTAQLQAAVVTYNARISGTGVSDGDKGDIDVTGGGTVWTVDTSAITTIKIAASAVDSTKIATGGIGNTDLAALIVTGSKIANSTIDSTKIATGGIGNTDLAAGIVTTTKIADDAVTLAKQASGTANRLQGFDASGNPSEITVGAPLTLSAGALDITPLASNGLTMDGDTTQLGGSSINEDTYVGIPKATNFIMGTQLDASSISPFNDNSDSHYLFSDADGWGMGIRTTFGPSKNILNSYQTGFESRTRSRYSTTRWISSLISELSGTKLRGTNYVREGITGTKIYSNTVSLDTVSFNGFSALGFQDGSNKKWYAGLGKAGSGVTDTNPWKGTSSDSTLSYAIGYSPNGALDFRYIDVLLRDTTADAISFYDGAYKFNNAAISTTSGDTTIMAWVGGNNPIYLDKTDFGGGGGSGTVSSGTTNTVAKYTGTTTVGNSSITDDGSVVTVDVSGQTALVATGGLHAGISARSDNASGNSHLFLENSADADNSYRLSRSDAGNLDLIRSSAYPYGSDTDTIWTYNQSTGAFAFKVSSITNNGSSLGTTYTTSNGIGLNGSDIRLGNSYMASAPPIFTANRNLNLATFKLNLGTNADSTMFVFDGNTGSFGIGTSSPLTKFNVVETSTSSPRGILSTQINTGTDGARVGFNKARGTIASPTTVATGDVLGKMVFRGYDGSNYLEMGDITVGASGTVASTRVPTYMAFSTATNAAPSVLTERMRILNDGKVGIGTSSPGYLIGIGSSLKGLDQYGTSNVKMKVVNSVSSDATFGVQNTDAAGFSGIEYLTSAGSPAVFTGYNNGVAGEFRFNNVASSGYIAFKIASTDALVIANSRNIGVGTSSPDRLFHVEASDAATNTVTYTTRNTHITSGTAAANFGSGTETELEDGAGNNEVALRSSTIWTDATNGSEDAHQMLSLVKAGTVDTVSIMKSTGQFQLTEYGGGAFTGTPTYQLSADVNGNLIETAAPLNATATLDFPSTAINTCSELTITVTGAADGDVVALGTPNAVTVTGAVFTAWVSATNTVTVQYCNTSTVGAGNPASADFKVRVLK